MQLLTYEEIREKALLQGISDNKVSIGMWAKKTDKEEGVHYVLCTTGTTQLRFI